VCTYILELFGSRRKGTKQALPELLTPVLLLRLQTRLLLLLSRSYTGVPSCGEATLANEAFCCTITLVAQLGTEINVLRSANQNSDLRCTLVRAGLWVAAGGAPASEEQ
jgi:hypothetical protein